nr:immunoglobulin light chain junction region [Macaca mulatta]MOW52648.1 immunoglobulin light chain junction region [Macaca mulatta]MOW52830.1 immunoglobulin light chain junction region [Macaca mulatta]MOW55820.1 immunoglobulin light chain junction region [Macaca mulatta]MOW55913.1 immunoglobulin light chain junction region [Macaca mulatta]
CGQGTHWPYSF